MDAYHARYPFLDAARDAVSDADVDLGALVRSDDAAVERGKERVTRALTEGTVESERRVSTRTELLSYPIARVLVSLLDTPGAIEKYAAIEATTAHTRVVEELTSGQNGRDTRADRPFSLETVLAELGLDADVQRSDRSKRNETAAYRVSVGRYLRLAPDDEEWTLVRRELADGSVSVSQSELLELLRKAIEKRVLDGLPFEVPTEIADPLRPAVREIRSRLVGVEYPQNIDRFEPEAFPDCIAALLESAKNGEIDRLQRFTLVSFLSGIGLSSEAIAAVCGIDDDRFAHATERLADGAYPPPSFETLRAYGICDGNHPDHDHPLGAYAARLSSASDEHD